MGSMARARSMKATAVKMMRTPGGARAAAMIESEGSSTNGYKGSRYGG